MRSGMLADSTVFIFANFRVIVSMVLFVENTTEYANINISNPLIFRKGRMKNE